MRRLYRLIEKRILRLLEDSMQLYEAAASPEKKFVFKSFFSGQGKFTLRVRRA